jgi:hypothetical protein
MARRHSQVRRSRMEWAGLGALSVVTAFIGWQSVAFTAAQVTAKGDPAMAHRLAPANAYASALLATLLSGADAIPADRRRADQLAWRALRHDPTVVTAASALGFNAQVRGDTAAAKHMFDYVQTLSRRNLQAQLWAIEYAVSRGDVPGALRHYDIALRTSPESAQTLFPVLVSASADPDIRTALTRTLAGGSPWSEGFVNFAAASGADPKVITQLFVALHRAGVAVSDNARASLVSKLISAGALEDAWAYYAESHRGADRRQSRDPRFRNIDTPSLLDWVPISDGGVSASIQRDGDTGVLEFSAPSSAGGPVVEQLQLLPPGNYRIQGHSDGIEQMAEARPYWILQCREGRELGRVVLPDSAEARGEFDGRFTVPQGCPVQMLALVLRPSEAVSGVSGRIDRLQLTPIR